MDWDISFEPDGLAVVTLRGAFSVEAHRRMVSDVVGHPEWQPGRPVLFDNRQLDLTHTHYADIMATRDNHAAQDDAIGEARSAILVAPGASFGVMRQFELVAEGAVEADLHIFTDEAKAREWLNAGRPTE
jgi:hypothetical protein